MCHPKTLVSCEVGGDCSSAGAGLWLEHDEVKLRSEEEYIVTVAEQMHRVSSFDSLLPK